MTHNERNITHEQLTQHFIKLQELWIHVNTLNLEIPIRNEIQRTIDQQIGKVEAKLETIENGK